MANGMLGDKLLPESVQTRRRDLRSRVNELRQPLRQRRQNLVPGPDVVGEAENRLGNIRNRVVDRQTVLERIQSMRQNNSDSGSSDESGSSSSSNNSNRSSML